MKNIKSFLTATVVAFSLGSAAAGTVTYITGATSFEGVTDNALTNYVAANGGARIAWDNATLGKETNELFNYTNASGTSYIVVAWTGSEHVIQALAAPTNSPVTLSFFPTNIAAGLNASSAATVAHSPQIGIYDNYQATSIFNGLGAGDGKNYAHIANDTILAAEGYVWIVNTNWPTSHGTNITTSQIRDLYAAGAVPLAYITGNNADTNSSVFAVGRNIDGGTRTVVFNESGVGVVTPVVQYQITSSNSITPYPIETIDGISSGSLGNSGYSLDGNLRAVFTNTLAGGAGIDQSGNWTGYAGGNNYILGYTSIKNATGSAGVIQLSYNGYAPTAANIQNGTYSLWALVHLGVSPNYADATATSLGTTLSSTIKGYTTSQLGTGNSSLTDLQVYRGSDGGNIYWNR